MKTKLVFAISLLLALTFAYSAEAANPKIRLELDESLTATAYLDREGNNYTACRLKGGSAYVEVPPASGATTTLGRAQAGTDYPGTEAASFVVAAIAPGAEVECTTSPAPVPRPLPDAKGFQGVAGWAPVSVVPLDYKKSAGHAPPPVATPVFAPGNDWFAYTPRWRQALIGAIGEPVGCKVLGANGAVKGDVICTAGVIGADDGRVSFKLDQELEPAQIEVTFSDQNAPAVKLRVLPCAFEPSGPVPMLVRGAERQTLRITAKQRECLVRVQNLSALVLGPERVPATVIHKNPSFGDGDLASGIQVQIMGVPTTLPLSDQTFTLKSANGPLGKMPVVVLDAVTTGDPPKIEVTYRAPVSAPEALKAIFEGANGVNDGVAVITPSEWYYGVISNTIRLSYPPLPTAGGTPPAAPVPITLSRYEVTRSESTLRWQVAALDPANTQIEACNGANPCWLAEQPKSLTFRVGRMQQTAIRAKMTLVEIEDLDVTGFDSTNSVWSQGKAQRHTNVIEIGIDLAKSSRTESVPMPIRDRLYVDCRGAKVPILDGETRAIDDADVVNGACALFIEPWPVRQPAMNRWSSLFDGLSDEETKQCAAKLSALTSCITGCEALQTAYDGCRDLVRERTLAIRAGDLSLLPEAAAKKRSLLNPLFGPQRLVVTFKRDGSEIASQLWDIDPSTRNWLVLPKAADEKRGDIYDVEVRLAGKANDGVNYKHPDQGNATQLQPAELRYHARLRSRGLFGFKQPWNHRTIGMRLYATLPVQLTGFRFPAAPKDLSSSSDPTSFQYLTPRTGILMVGEPWNYDTGQNPWPLNPSASIGFMALELTKPRVDLTFVLGAQVKLPLGDSSGQLSSSAALGVFWEHDVAQGLDLGNRFLLTFGANVFSLFSGK
ncbi:MAG: hypothetical protein U0359_20370 [Byssovorax sp.]